MVSSTFYLDEYIDDLQCYVCNVFEQNETPGTKEAKGQIPT